MPPAPGPAQLTDEHAAAPPVERGMVLVAVLSAVAAAASLVATGFMVVGMITGAALDSPVRMIGGGVLLVFGFGAGAYRAATARPVRGAPQPTGEPPMASVRNGMGTVFWLWSALAAGGWVGTVYVSVVALHRWGDDDGRELTEMSGPAGVGVALTVMLFLVGLASMAMLVPGRILRARHHVPLWVSREGIGFPPASPEDPGFLRWARVAAVSHKVHDTRGLVYSHAWTITSTDRQWWTVVYPAGASPRPRAVCRAIRDVAPAVEVSR